jgi:hypothetical protein
MLNCSQVPKYSDAGTCFNNMVLTAIDYGVLAFSSDSSAVLTQGGQRPSLVRECLNRGHRRMDVYVL